MADENTHSAQVDGWIERAAAGDVPPEKLVQSFEAAFGALWRRAHLTLGEITLTAIVDRVLYTAGEQFPFLALIEVRSSGPRFDDLREHARAMAKEPLIQGIRFVLVELLTVFGSLTAEILSPALHAALAASAPGGASVSSAQAQSRSESRERTDDQGEGVK